MFKITIYLHFCQVADLTQSPFTGYILKNITGGALPPSSISSLIVTGLWFKNHQMQT